MSALERFLAQVDEDLRDATRARERFRRRVLEGRD
jgi:hypothetical protein